MSQNIGIIGGGIVGLAVAIKLRNIFPDSEITIWEKEKTVGQHQSTHNSGVLHAGLYYKKGSLKAKLSIAGIREMTGFAREHCIKYDICGKLVVASNEEELSLLRYLYQRGQSNGLKGLRLLNRNQMLEIEPNVGGIAAVHVPEEGIIDYAAVVSKMHQLLEKKGVQIRTGARARCLFDKRQKNWFVEANQEVMRKHFLINCAGLYSDRVAKECGENIGIRIVPFRGEYFKLRTQSRGLVNNLIYPVPDPQYPFLGVHFTRLITGDIEAGPNAVLSLSREGYRKGSLSFSDAFESLSFPGLWNFVGRHRRMCIDEIYRSYSRRQFTKALQKLVPSVTVSDLQPGGAGVRAQAMNTTGELIQDFMLIERSQALHVLNAPSPAATASFAIGSYIAAAVKRLL